MSAESAVLAAAFQAELSKRINALPHRPVGVQWLPAEKRYEHLKAARQVNDSVQYYVAKLPDHVYVPILLDSGDALLKKGEWAVADITCYRVVSKLGLHGRKYGPTNLTDVQRIAGAVRARMGQAVCRLSICQDEDPNFHSPHTLPTVEAALHALRDAITLALRYEDLYWLVLNGTVHTYRAAKPLAARGHAREALAPIVHCVLALEANIRLALPRFLPWRATLYSLATRCLLDLGDAKAAGALVQSGIESINDLVQIQNLDPVPCPPEVAAAYAAALRRLRVLQLAAQLSAAPEDGGVAASSEDILSRCAAAGDADGRAGTIEAMLDALQKSERRLTDHAPPAEGSREAALLEALRSVLAPLAQEIVRGCETRATAPEEEDAAAEDAKEPAPADGAEEGGGDETPPELTEAQKAMQAGAAAEADLSEWLHGRALVAAYANDAWDLFQDLTSAAHARLGEHAAEGLPPGGTLPVVLGLLEGMHAVDGETHAAPDTPSADADAPATPPPRRAPDTSGNGDAARAAALERIEPLREAIEQHSDRAISAAPDLLLDAVGLLYSSLEGAIRRYFTVDSVRCEPLELALRTLDHAYCHLDHHDPMLSLSVAMKLAVSQGEGGKLKNAIAVLQRAKWRAEIARERWIAARDGMECEATLWPTASRSQPDAATRELVASMPEAEQFFACMHADLLSLLGRLRLQQGVKDQRAAAQRRQETLIDTIDRRDKESMIWGARTEKERRVDAQRVQKAIVTPVNPVAAEKELLADAGDSLYERAVALIEMAPFQGAVERQAQLLQQAHECLLRAEAAENEFIALAHRAAPQERLRVPPSPVVLSRTTRSVRIACPEFRAKGAKPTHFAVYGKSRGAGTGLSINSTAAELDGLGEPVRIGEEVTVSGLTQNTAYNFAVACYTASGELYGELGEPTPVLPAALPLPLLQLHGYVGLMGHRLGLLHPLKMAVNSMSAHFLLQRDARPIWEANPVDSVSLNKDTVAIATPPLLRSFVLLLYASAGESQPRADPKVPRVGLADSATIRPLPYGAPAIDGQLRHLRLSRNLLIGMQVASMIGDQRLMCEGGVRVNNHLAPLLAVRGRPQLLTKAVAQCHAALQLVTDTGLELAREAMPAAAQVALHSMQLLEKGREADACRELGRLHSALLTAAGGVEEVTKLQEYLLMHPDLTNVDSEVLKRRIADTEDVVAAVLRDIATLPLQDVWAKLADTPGPGKPEGAGVYRAKLRRGPLAHRYMEFLARMVERAFEEGRDALVTEWALEAREVMHDALCYLGPCEPARWRIEDAVEASTMTQAPEADVEEARRRKKAAQGLQGGDSGGDGDALPELDEDEAAAVLLEAKRRDAAARFLQTRCKERTWYLKKRKEVRALIAASQPWLSRINCVLGLVRTGKACKLPREDSAPRPARDDAESAPEPEDDAEQDLSGFEDTPGGGPGTAAQRDGEVPDSFKHSAQLDAALSALRCFCRAAELAARSHRWDLVSDTVGHLWNSLRLLLEAHGASLQRPAARAVTQMVPWVRFMRTRPLPPVGEEWTPEWEQAHPPASPSPEKLEQKVAINVGKDNLARVLRVPLARMLDLIDLRGTGGLAEGLAVTEDAAEAMPFVLYGAEPPRASAPMDFGSLARAGTLRNPMAGTGSVVHDEPDADSPDYGAEVPNPWFSTATDVDIHLVGEIVVTTMVLFKAAQRHGWLFQAGARYHRLTYGRFAEAVIPHLIAVAPVIGKDLVPWRGALESAVRDKSIVLEELDKTRASTKHRIGAPAAWAIAKPKRSVSKLRRTQSNQQGGEDEFSDAASMRSLSSSRSTRSEGTATSGSALTDDLYLPERYRKALDKAKEMQEKLLLAQAQNELGDVHIHFGKRDLAMASWSDCLDSVTGRYGSCRGAVWRKHFRGVSPKTILAENTLQVLLFAFVPLGKLCRYGREDGVDLRADCGHLASLLALACFSGTFTHPQRPADFAAYVPVELCEGDAALFNSHTCPNVTDLQSSLQSLGAALVHSGGALDALPVLSLLDYVSTRVTANAATAVYARLLRAEALCDLGFLESASRMMLDLMLGRNLPSRTRGGRPLVLKDDDGNPMHLELPEGVSPFQEPKDASDEGNMRLLKYVAEWQPEKALLDVLGPHAMSGLHLVRARFLYAVGMVPNMWLRSDSETSARLAAPVTEPTAEMVALHLSSKCLGALIAEHVVTPEEPPPAAKGGKGGKDADKGKKGADAKGGKGAKDAKGGAKGGESKREVAAAVLPLPVPPEESEPPLGTATEELDNRTLLTLSRAFLQLAMVRKKQWLWRHALRYCLESLRFAGAMTRAASEERQVNATHDAMERRAATPEMFVDAYAMIVDLYLFLGLPRQCMETASAANEQARAAKHSAAEARFHGTAALAAAQEGLTLSALYDLEPILEKLLDPISGTAVPARTASRILLDAGCLYEGLGAQQDAARLYEAAEARLRGEMRALGLHEHREHPELRNRHLACAGDFCEALVRHAASLLRRGDFAEASDLAEEALSAMSLYHSMPHSKARAAHLAGRAARHLALRAEDHETALRHQKAAFGHLQRALRWAVLDGGPDYRLAATCACEAAAMHHVRQDAPRMAACLHIAVDMYQRHTKLLNRPKAGAVAAELVPAWALELTEGRKEALKGVADRMPVEEEEEMDVSTQLSHLLRYNLTQAAMSGPLSRSDCWAQAAALHGALLTGGDEYVRSCGPIADGALDLNPESPAEVPVGTAVIAWMEEEGSNDWPQSWHETGSLRPQIVSRTATDADAVNLPKPALFFTMLVVVHEPDVLGRPTTGLCALPGHQARDLHWRVNNVIREVEAFQPPEPLEGEEPMAAGEDDRLQDLVWDTMADVSDPLRQAGMGKAAAAAAVAAVDERPKDAGIESTELPKWVDVATLSFVKQAVDARAGVRLTERGPQHVLPWLVSAIGQAPWPIGDLPDDDD
ncbi:unnamed protein product [Pedinophyceae sp. YPF-701]|nr:unnamed protein product [Pedinophyceae sp. YPF-701]